MAELQKPPPSPAPDAGLWDQISGLTPQLRDGVELVPQTYRGDRWYVLHDQATGRFLRFNVTAFEFLGRLDGQRSVIEIVALATQEAGGREAIKPADVMQIMAQLHHAEVLRGGLPVGTEQMLERYQKAQRQHKRPALSNPLAIRIPIFDPDRLLNALLVPAKCMFSWAGLGVWLLVVLTSVTMAVAHWDSLTASIADKTFTVSDILLFWALYPVVKGLHELGHGLAVKVWGGEVHETGITLLMFMPVPYLDASAASAFRDKRKRAIVSAAGIIVELFIACLALLVWLAAEPGLLREIALNLVLIGGVSTLLFNGNPLLKFDGYYVLEDLIEIPGLASRSSKFYIHHIQKRLLGIDDSPSPVTAKGEKAWFSVYGVLAPMYRMFMMVTIALYLAKEFMIIGIMLAMWSIFMQLIKPLYTSLVFIATSPRLEAKRTRAVIVLTSTIAGVVALFSIQVPLITLAHGVNWAEEKALVVSGVDGFVKDIASRPNTEVQSGDVLLRLSNPLLHTRRSVLQARLQELTDEKHQERTTSRVRAAIIDEDIEAVRAEFEDVQRQIEALTVRSEVEGRFVTVDPHTLQDKRIRHGDLVGYVVVPGQHKVRAVVTQDAIGLLRSQDTEAEVMLASQLGRAWPAEIIREVPAASRELPSIALGTLGGGKVAVDLTDQSGQTASKEFFQIELELPPEATVRGIGERVYVRLDHGHESIWQQCLRRIRQLFLSQLRA